MTNNHDETAKERPAWSKSLHWLNENLEKTVILISYTGMAGVIFIEVIRRFLFSQQVAWSTSIPILLFLWLTWFGAALNVKQRSHLSLNEIRQRLPYWGQYLCLVLDAVLWIGFGVLVIYYSTLQVTIAYTNYSIVAGTDDVLLWWFYCATPLGWVLIIFRVLQNLYADTQRFKKGQLFNLQPTVME